jgi:hypothetical protein
MPDEEKDRFGEKLREVEKAREDVFFAERDRELLEKMKAQPGGQAEESVRASVKGRCPRCGEHLVGTSRHDVAIAECPRDHGIWLDDGELEKLMTRENSGWLARILGRPR